ncbi:sigma-54 dependent transcriptional regulator [uncultured Paludibaculum sp.]|uniref:sigma-54-dependent transcriptional regulator n=1 Tax=uncultured Paludibaculum sp. TaxID=1765020 RepID=UPI002AAAE8A4|nr:sigma-54 dependent transcriptional regulator [uncultured Paludibaculum sp.]
MSSVLLVEDDPSVRSTISTFLELEGYAVEAVSSTREAFSRLSNASYPIVISDIYIDERTGIDILNAARTANDTCAVILMSARGSMETVMAATRGGAFDYLAKPFELDDLLSIVKRAEGAAADELEDEDFDAEEPLATEMIGSSAKLVEIYKTISRVAPTDALVLIEGETGTGKELIAHLLHANSKRSAMPFLPVDCASLAPSLVESELFGAMKGAYTGADRDRAGVFETAHGGTVFLDEIGEIDLNFQLKLLRFLQEKEIRPLGSSRPRKVDVRILAATNRNLRKMVDEGKFREDLWYRLDVVRIGVPPLRERHGDVPLLAGAFLKRYNERYGLDTRLTESGMKALADYTWPGNIRQLQHMVERLVILSPGGRITEDSVDDAIRSSGPKEQAGESLADTEMEQIRKVLAATGGNKSRAARILGIERKTLYRKLERMGLA